MRLRLTWKPLSFSGHRPPRLTCVSRAGFGLLVSTGNTFLVPAPSIVLLNSFLQKVKTIRLGVESRLHESFRSNRKPGWKVFKFQAFLKAV